MMNKRTLLIGSGVVTIVLFVLNWIGTFKLCGGQEYGGCIDLAYGTIINFLPVIPLFLFSLVTYRMRDEVYRTWSRFAYVWIPLSMVLILLSPEYGSDWMYPIEKSTVAFVSLIIFTFASLSIIVWKLTDSRRN